MDPITTAIVATLPALASDLIKSSVKDAYAALKAIIRRKWGDASPVAKSIDALEANPKSGAQAEAVAQHIAAVNATADAEVMKVLAKLIDELTKEGIGGEAITRIGTSHGLSSAFLAFQAGIEQRAVFEHGADDVEKTVADGAQSAGMAATAGLQSKMLGFLFSSHRLAASAK